VNRKKQKQMIEEAPVDKMDLFLATHYRKLLLGVAVLLVLFIAGYAFKSMNESKDQLLVNKVGQLEMLFEFNGTTEAQLNDFVAVANQYPDAGDYINLKAAEVLVKQGKMDLVDIPLSSAGGDFKELADGLRFDIGMGDVNPEQYLTESVMTPLWYYRAYLAADDAKKTEILTVFQEKYKENELLKQIERWDG